MDTSAVAVLGAPYATIVEVNVPDVIASLRLVVRELNSAVVLVAGSIGIVAVTVAIALMDSISCCCKEDSRRLRVAEILTNCR